MPRDLTVAATTDDFLSGPNGSTTSTGAINWQSSATTTPNGVAAHPGIIRCTTPASNGASSWIALSASAPLVPAESFDMLWIFKLTTADGTNGQRVGAATATSGQPVDGIYLEKLEGDTSWFGVTRAAGVQTRSAALAAADTAWHKLRVRRVDGSTVGFTLDAGTEVLQTTNLPTVALNPWAVVFNAAASAAQRILDVDYFDLQITGVVR